MLSDVPEAGAAGPEIRRLVETTWSDTMRTAHPTFPPLVSTAPLADRVAAARVAGLEIGGVLSRFSTKLQHSTTDQVRECVEYAARNKFYIPPEFICVDEGVSGRKLDRDGLNRMKALLAGKHVGVLLVYKVSRLFRVGYQGFQFFQEEIVEEGLRAISISQGIDTAKSDSWKCLTYMHGIMDEMLLGTIADHVRTGLSGLFRQGYVTGALTLGYRGQEVPGMPTKLGRPRRMPVLDEPTAELIREHYALIRDGLPIKVAWHRWVKAGGPCDRRSRGRMSYGAYRRMLSNPRYTGRWVFGQTRSEWSMKREYARKVLQPETHVSLYQCDELRIVDDPLYFAVQERLAGFRKGPYAPKRRREPRLWDLVTDCFHCAVCQDADGGPARFYQGGAHGNGMRCKEGQFCPQLTVVRRDAAVRAVCARLEELVRQDEALLVEVLAQVREIEAVQTVDVAVQLGQLDRTIAQLGRKIDDLCEMAGSGTAEDRAQLRAKVAALQGERAARRSERSQLAKPPEKPFALSPEEVRAQLHGLAQLLVDGAAGAVPEENRYRAAELFRQLVGGSVLVTVHPRPGRKETTVSGSFTPNWLGAAARNLGRTDMKSETKPAAETVWLRSPPLVDELAPRVRQLIDGGMSYRAAAEQLQSEGYQVNNGAVYQIYRRAYEILGQPLPPRVRAPGRARQPTDDTAN